jgi:hypothetical protein
MPRGSKPGERCGGRRRATKNKATLERALVNERVMNESQMKGRKLGKEVLEEFMLMFSGLAAAFQPAATGPTGKVTPEDLQRWASGKNEVMFEKYSKLAMKAAHDLAEYQSPKLAAVHVVAPPPAPTGPIIKKFTIHIFDDQGRPALRHIDVKSALASAANVDANPGHDQTRNGNHLLSVPENKPKSRGPLN